MYCEISIVKHFWIWNQYLRRHGRMVFQPIPDLLNEMIKLAKTTSGTCRVDKWTYIARPDSPGHFRGKIGEITSVK